MKRISRRVLRSKTVLRQATNKQKTQGRVSTGIANFDKLVQGGFERASTNILVGGPGSGKTIFSTSFLVHGMQQGEPCLYVTFEEKKEQFYANMKQFGWDLAKYEAQGLFTFLEYTPLKVKTMLEEGGGSIESIIIGKKISRLVIDSITSFALLFEDELAKREAALSLFNMIKKWNSTSLLTLEEGGFDDEHSHTKAIEFESDAIIVLYFSRIKNERTRLLEIIKMRGTKHSGKMYRFSITSKGIIVQSSPASVPLNI